MFILRKTRRVFRDRLLLSRYFRGFVLHVWEYCSAVWCASCYRYTHLKLLDRVVSGACFYQGVCRSVALHIIDLWQIMWQITWQICRSCGELWQIMWHSCGRSCAKSVADHVADLWQIKWQIMWQIWGRSCVRAVADHVSELWQIMWQIYGRSCVRAVADLWQITAYIDLWQYNVCCGSILPSLHIIDLWQYYVCCIRSGVTRCTLFMERYLCRMFKCGLHAVLGLHIGILLSLIACRT